MLAIRVLVRSKVKALLIYSETFSKKDNFVLSTALASLAVAAMVLLPLPLSATLTMSDYAVDSMVLLMAISFLLCIR